VTAGRLVAACLAPLLLMACGDGRGCGAVLANASDETVEQVYLVPAGAGLGADLLETRDLAPGATMPLRFPGRGPHAMRAVWASGRAVEAPSVEACRITRVTLSDGGLRQE
jgi:hypothetical protein